MFRLITTAGRLPQALQDRQAEFKAAQEWVRRQGLKPGQAVCRLEPGQGLADFPNALWTRLP